jgi:hypothetical protein
MRARSQGFVTGYGRFRHWSTTARSALLMKDLSRPERLAAALAEAEAALAASKQALRTHGHSNVSWLMYRENAKRVARLSVLLHRAEYLNRRG